MALNIKNDRVCALAREAAERTGRTQVSVLEAALTRYLDALDDPNSRDLGDPAQRRFDDARAVVAEFTRTVTDDDRAAVRHDLDAMYDEAGLPLS